MSAQKWERLLNGVSRMRDAPTVRPRVAAGACFQDVGPGGPSVCNLRPVIPSLCGGGNDCVVSSGDPSVRPRVAAGLFLVRQFFRVFLVGANRMTEGN